MTQTDKIVLEVEPRTDKGKNACRRLRAAGTIPGNVYGLDAPPFMVAVDPKRIEALLRLESGANTIFTLSLAGEQRKRHSMIKELQRDPVTEQPIHVDFVRVDTTKVVQVSVPIRLVGTAEGVKNEGGIMDFVHREVAVECLPGDIPEHLDVDVTALHVNQNVALKDLAVAAGIRILDDPEQIIAVVVPPRVEEVPVEEVPAEAAEAEAPKAAEGEGEAPSGDESKK